MFKCPVVNLFLEDVKKVEDVMSKYCVWTTNMSRVVHKYVFVVNKKNQTKIH